MKSKMKSAIKEKIDNDARRKVGKLYGFKQSSWCNWMIKDGYFFYIMHGTFTKDADLYVKPCYYDDILWRLSPGEDSDKRPNSLRAMGDFTAPKLNDDSLARMLQMIYHKQYKEAGAIAEELVKNGKMGGYRWGDGNGNYKYLNEYIADYCRKYFKG